MIIVINPELSTSYRNHTCPWRRRSTAASSSATASGQPGSAIRGTGPSRGGGRQIRRDDDAHLVRQPGLQQRSVEAAAVDPHRADLVPLSEQPQRAAQIDPVLPQHDVADAVAAQPV
jgi:hypothetical protein